MTDIQVTVPGHLTADPEVSEVNGTTKVQFTIASNPSVFRDGKWVDLPAVFFTCQVWGGLAQAVAQRYQRGSFVIASGVMRANEYENREGAKKRFQYLKVENIGTHIASREGTNQAQYAPSITESAQSGYETPSSTNRPTWGVNQPHSGNSGDWGRV